MKTHYLLFFLAIQLSTVSAQSKAFEKHARYNSIGFGASQFFHIVTDQTSYHPYYSPYRHAYIGALSGQFNYYFEKAVADYVGIGLILSAGGQAGRLAEYAEFNTALGMLANFHFYQLIADKSGKNIHSDKLDIYAGINLGGGIALNIHKNRDFSNFVPLVFGGFQAGARYFFTPRAAVNLEVGYGKSLITGGFTFKFMPKKFRQ